MYILCHYHLFFQSIPSIYAFGKNYFFVSLKQIPFTNFFLCHLKFPASPFLLNIRFFLSVSSRLSINLYIVLKSSFSLLSSSMLSCIFFILSLYSRAPFSARIRWMNAVAQIKFALIEQSNQYEKNYLVQWV